MSLSDLQTIIVGTLSGLLASTGFLLAMFIGFLVIAGLTKIYWRERNSMIVRNLSERMGSKSRYLSPTAPRGPSDQLQTPELLEQSSRHQ